MKMKKELMKRVAAAGLAVSMVAGLTACGPTGKPEETKKEETKAETQRDVCSSDLPADLQESLKRPRRKRQRLRAERLPQLQHLPYQIGRASCRERVFITV